ncbi:XrtA system polysaccharide chain length determinant [Desulfosarcina sp.]|uniref:XrtA system polysaccharide chain length determinant n=1 Tax=Desulfosarcina sp. TaxID=2027861 RepID=UPI003970C606
MSSQPAPMDPKAILDIVIKRRWVVIIPFFLAMIAGIGLSVKLPRIYEASTLILIQPQKVPQEYVQSIVTTDPGDRISTLSQQILSRTNLEKIIDEFKLYQGPEYKNLYVEDKINSLRSSITVSVSNDKRRDNDAFTISHQGKDPQTVMRITNTLASFFIDENLRIREAQAVGTSDFLEDELAVMKKRLETVEVQLKGYREAYMGELPEQLESNLRILDRLQEHMSDVQQRLSDARIRLATLQNEAAAQKGQPARITVGGGSSEESTDLDQLNAELENLLTRYTARHPDVLRLEARIADLEAQAIKFAAAEEKAGAAAPNGQDAAPVLSADMRAEHNEIVNDIRRLEADIRDTKEQIDRYQGRIENTPKREQELLSLRRDYENIQTTYNSLLARKLESEIAVNMERKQKGEQFRVLDTARLPEKPVKPDMKKLFALIVGAGLGVGGAIIFLLEYLDNTLKRPGEIESELGLTVLCMVPEIISRKTRILRRVEHVFFALAGVATLVLLTGFATLYVKGVDQTLTALKNWVG